MNPTNLQLTRRILPFGILGAIILLLLIGWFATSSSIDITSTNGASGKYTYTLLNQHNNKLVTAKNKGAHYKHRLGPGTYEVSVSQNSKTYFSVVTIKGLFGKTSMTAALGSEQARTFMGDNPSSCTNILGSTLYSHDCGTYNATVNTHVPSTPDQPTYTDTRPSSYGNIQSTIETKAGTGIALFYTKPRFEREEAGAGIAQYTAYAYDPANPAFAPIDSAPLADLSQFKGYLLAAYQDGFLAYSSDFSQALYYASIHAKPVSITLANPDTDGLQATGLSANQSGAVAISYSAEINADATAKDVNKAAKTEVVITKNGAANHFTFTNQYSMMSFCGPNLCLLNPGTNALEAYDVASAPATLKYTLHDVSTFAASDTTLVAARKDGLLKLDPATFTGALAYSFGGYSFCGLSPVVGGHTVCVTNPKGTHSALFVSDTTPDTNTIDKKVLALEANSNVVKLSIVGSVIYVLPKGENIYNLATRSLAPDPVVQGKINQNIIDAADKASLDRHAYTFIITRPL